MRHAPLLFTPEVMVDSPGRINLIGEHTDYNLGYVLPAAIDKKVHFYFRKTTSPHTALVYSTKYDEPLIVNLEKVERSKIVWENYVLGVIDQLLQRGKKLSGFECVIDSNLPVGSGLSSSAALECGMTAGLNALFDLQLDKNEIAALSRQAEHEFVGTKCGIMDQFASVNGQQGHVILLDCRSLEHTYIPAVLGPYKLLLLNSNVTHQLADGQYNSRQDECLEALAILQKSFPEVQSLRDVSTAIAEACQSQLTPIQLKRIRYVLEENKRVLEAVNALQQEDVARLGAVLYAGHDGLKNLYEVSCPELDFLVDFAKTKSYVAGARMMGGGFGGCTLNLVHEDFIEEYIQEASEVYKRAFSIELSSYPVALSEGTMVKNAGR